MKKKRGKTALLIGGVVLGLALIGLSVWLLLGRNETPLYRTTYSVTSLVETDSGTEQFSSSDEYRYFQDGTGLLVHSQEDADYTLELTLNEKGQIASALRRSDDGTILNRTEYEYDRYGNQSHIMIYGEDGLLRREQIYTYEPYHVFSQYTLRTFEYGEETTRQVLVFTDRTNGVSQYFSNGTLISTRPVRRVFEGNKLVCQIMLNEDGSTASEFYWERDDEGNILSYDVPYGENLRRVTTYTYERIG